MEVALLAALVKLIDGYITPLQTRIKCWKIRGTDGYFIVGMTIPQFTGPDDNLDWFIPARYWDKFNVIEIVGEIPKGNFKITEVIEKLYKI